MPENYETISNENIKNMQNKQNMNNNQTMENQNIYTPAFLREQIGKLMKVEFLIGTNNLVDRIGILQDVGESYILLRSVENDSLVYCDIYSIKFITISVAGMCTPMSGYNNFNGYNKYY